MKKIQIDDYGHYFENTHEDKARFQKSDTLCDDYPVISEYQNMQSGSLYEVGISIVFDKISLESIMDELDDPDDLEKALSSPFRERVYYLPSEKVKALIADVSVGAFWPAMYGKAEVAYLRRADEVPSEVRCTAKAENKKEGLKSDSCIFEVLDRGHFVAGIRIINKDHKVYLSIHRAENKGNPWLVSENKDQFDFHAVGGIYFRNLNDLCDYIGANFKGEQCDNLVSSIAAEGESIHLWESFRFKEEKPVYWKGHWDIFNNDEQASKFKDLNEAAKAVSKHGNYIVHDLLTNHGQFIRTQLGERLGREIKTRVLI